MVEEAAGLGDRRRSGELQVAQETPPEQGTDGAVREIIMKVDDKREVAFLANGIYVSSCVYRSKIRGAFKDFNRIYQPPCFSDLPNTTTHRFGELLCDFPLNFFRTACSTLLKIKKGGSL